VMREEAGEKRRVRAGGKGRRGEKELGKQTSAVTMHLSVARLLTMSVIFAYFQHQTCV